MTLDEYFGILRAVGETLRQRGIDFTSIEHDELYLTIPGRPGGFDIHVMLDQHGESAQVEFDLDGWRQRIVSFQDALELIELGLSPRTELEIAVRRGIRYRWALLVDGREHSLHRRRRPWWGREAVGRFRNA
jgi:hypothetical protein